jgi:hypothetical protein
MAVKFIGSESAKSTRDANNNLSTHLPRQAAHNHRMVLEEPTLTVFLSHRTFPPLLTKRLRTDQQQQDFQLAYSRIAVYLNHTGQHYSLDLTKEVQTSPTNILANARMVIYGDYCAQTSPLSGI